jgi:hypothetical protein
MASPEALKLLRDLQLSDENKVCRLRLQRRPNFAPPRKPQVLGWSLPTAVRPA